MFISERTAELKCEFNVAFTGYWSVKISLYNAENGSKVCDFLTSRLNYNKYNYIKYIDPAAEHYNDALIGIDQLIRGNAVADSNFAIVDKQISELSAAGVNIADFFLEQGIDEISIFFDVRTSDLILPFIKCSNLKIRHLFTNDCIYTARTESCRYLIRDINGTLPLSEKDTILIASVHYDFLDVRAIFLKSRAAIYGLPYVLSCLMTKHLFSNKFKNKIPKIIAVRTPYLNRLVSTDHVNMTANEKVHDDAKFMSEAAITSRIINDYERLPPQLARVPKEELLETMKFPKTYLEPGSCIEKYIDVQGQYINVKNSARVTVGQPDSYIGTIYIFGTTHAFGYGVKDSETIASYLQEIIRLPYRVENYANGQLYDYSAVFHLIDNMKFGKNDIAVLIAANNQPAMINFGGASYVHWFRWETLEEPIVKVDALPLFEKRDRPDYILHRYGFTPECNLELAKLIRDAVYQNIKLFDIKDLQI